ncbi:MAG: prephenate dehydrogenase/arogenate dehydrogenase family protein [Deltaproteobacteria bacterium]|nr:prephenate dehydrogenase/arogenate dehydrogenase family protein [Deltaproteobacteria bacterium]
MEKPLINKLAVIGVGLMGGSLAMILKEKGEVGEVIGIGRGLENLQKAKELGIIDNYTQSLKEGLADADVIVVAIPVGSIASVVQRGQQYMKDGAIITDVGSVKGDIVRDVDMILDSRLSFIGGHPIAGTEKSGADAAFAELYRGSRCILTPSLFSDESALETVKKMWELTGARVAVMDVESHDKILAAISHLPHIVAYALVNTVDGVKDFDESILKYSAGGFRDFTRIASSSPEMWRDICFMNKGALLELIDAYMTELESIKAMINGDDHQGLMENFECSKRARDSI